LPGSIDDFYTVHFNIIPPSKIDLSLHKDWTEKYGNEFLKELSFKYQNINFKEIANAIRKQ